MNFNKYSFFTGGGCYEIGYNGNAPKPWKLPYVSKEIFNGILYLPISDKCVREVPVRDSKEELVDLLFMNNSRIKDLSSINLSYICYTYPGYSRVRLGIYDKLVCMLSLLPTDIGIAFSEALRPIEIQKQYFDKKFKENLESLKDKELAYKETCKSVSPFIDNIPTHATADIPHFEKS
jgi:hypothetical protein